MSRVSGTFKIRSIRFNFFMNLLLTGSSILFPLITFPIVSRALLTDAYGRCGFAISVVSWLSLVAMLGVNRYGVREVARVRDDACRLAAVTREILSVTLVSTALIYVGFIASLFLVQRFEADRLLLFINGFAIIGNTIGVAWFFQGIEQYSYITVRGVLIKLVCLAGVICLVRIPSDYLIYAAILVVASAVANVVNLLYMLRLTRDTHSERAKLDLKRHVKPLFIFFVIVASISVYTALDTVMLGFMSTNQQVGFYTAAMNIKSALVAVVSSLSAVLLPRASNLIVSGQESRFRQIVRKTVYLVLGVAIPFCFILAVFATPLIAWYGGAGFAGAGPALSVMTIAVIPIALSVIFCDEVMVPLGMEKLCTVIYLLAAVLDVVSNLLLIPRFGALGTAFSTLIVETSIAIVEFFIVRKHLWGASKGPALETSDNGTTSADGK